MGTPARATIEKAQARVLRWFGEHGRSFPWRDHRDPYATLVAEVMLQQTQTGRVIPSYEAFLGAFPTVRDLAHAPAMDVIRAWKGLGYNRRAVNLQRAAYAIEHDFGGEFPSAPAVLRTLPGVGEYSANAIACFAFNRDIPVVDVNVQRVLARVVLGADGDAVRPAVVRRLAAEWLPAGEAYRWNQALMDVGATLCRIETPLCTRCPLRAACRFRASGPPSRANAPTKRNKPEPFEGSRRQKRGSIVDALRAAAVSGVTMSALAKGIHHEPPGRDLTWLVELLEGLEADGLIRMSDAARRGSPRGIVRLPA